MKTVFVTGADLGVGYCLCECFIKGGYYVVAGQFMKDWPWLDELKAKYPDQVCIVPLDISDTESVKEAARLTAQAVDHIDILVSCAGIGGRDDYEGIHKVFSTNTVGAVRMVKAFLPLMKEGMKRLAFVSSEAGVNSLAHRTDGYAYTTSKTALNMIVRRMHRTLYPQGYTFRLYHPGWVRSYMM